MEKDPKQYYKNKEDFPIEISDNSELSEDNVSRFIKMDFDKEPPLLKDANIIVCIDPGPRNTGYCVYSLEKDSIIELDVIEIREEVSKDTTEQQRVALSIKGVREFVNAKWAEWNSWNAFIFIEDQIEGRRKGLFETNAIQNALHTLIGPNRVVIQLPHTVKMFFCDYYKMRDDAKTKHESNKKNAEEYFMKLLPPKWLVRVNYLKKTKRKKLDDVADAFFMAQLVACMRRSEPSHSQLRRLEEKRKKKEVRDLKKAETAKRKLKERESKKLKKILPKSKPKPKRKSEGEGILLEKRVSRKIEIDEELPQLNKLLE